MRKIKSSKSRILVAGAGGFIGSHVVQLLLQHGHVVRAFVHYNSLGRWGHLEAFVSQPHSRLQIVTGDVADARRVEEAIEGCDVVFHLAALIGIPRSNLDYRILYLDHSEQIE